MADSFIFAPLPQTALRLNLVVSILSAIFEGKLRAGDWLNAPKLASQFGVSATPIREALVELASVGVVKMEHNRGTVVRPFGPTQIEEIYQIRAILEAEATRSSCPCLDQQALIGLQCEMTDLMQKRGPDWSARAMASDRGFHDLIARNCGSDRLQEEISRYRTLVQCIRDVVGNQSHAQQRALPDHLVIIEALLAGEADRAAAAMRQHIRTTAGMVKEAMFPSSTRQPVEAEA